jgi:hypothetical protein
MSRNLALLICGALALAPQAVLAQGQPMPVFFEPSKEPQLNKAIMAALTQAPFVPGARYAPGVLVVTIPDQIAVEHLKVSGTTWTFTVAFSRNGDSLGQSVESCNEHRLADCTDQLVSDAKSAAGMAQ